MAEKGLYNLERRLFREPEITEEHKGIIDKHLEKRYVTNVPPTGGSASSEMVLTSFPPLSINNKSM